MNFADILKAMIDRSIAKNEAVAHTTTNIKKSYLVQTTILPGSTSYYTLDLAPYSFSNAVYSFSCDDYNIDVSIYPEKDSNGYTDKLTLRIESYHSKDLQGIQEIPVTIEITAQGEGYGW